MKYLLNPAVDIKLKKKKKERKKKKENRIQLEKHVFPILNCEILRDSLNDENIICLINLINCFHSLITSRKMYKYMVEKEEFKEFTRQGKFLHHFCQTRQNYYLLLLLIIIY